MSFTAIDLSKLPSPEVIETLDAAAIVADLKAAIIAAAPDLAEALALDSDPLVKVIEAFAYRETLLRNRVNQASKANMLAYATGGNLDHLAALLEVARFDGETDDALRRRVSLAPEGATAAGTLGAYLFYALSAHADVADAAVIAPEIGSGRVEITILSRQGDGAPAPEMLTTVAEVIEPRRVLTDLLTVHAPTVTPFAIIADLTLFPGPDDAVVLAAAEAALEAYLTASRLLGYDITLSALYAALHQPGVQRVALTSPTADIVCGPTEAAHCSAITLTIGGRDV